MPDGKTVDQSFDLEEIEKMILKAKKDGKPYAFAFGLTSKPEQCSLLVHRRKEPRALKGLVRKHNKAAQKVCFGTFTMDGNKILFAPTKPLNGIVKQLKRRFRDAGISKYKPFLVDQNGVELDEASLPDADQYVEDAVDQEAAAAGTQSEGPPQDAPAEQQEGLSADDIKNRLIAARDALGGWDGADKDQLIKLLRLGVQLLEAGELSKADAAASRLLERLQGRGAAAQPAQTQDRGAIQARLKEMLPQIKALQDERAREILSAKIREVAALIEQANLEGAGKGLDKIADALAKLGGQAAQPKEAADPMVVWRNAKELIDADITTLQNTLRGVSDPNVQQIVKFGLNGITEGNQVAMMRTLMEYNSATAEGRAKAGQAVIGQVKAYREFIQKNDVIALCENNPFGVKLNIQKPILSALDRIERTVAA